jgi:RecQ-mediated genome instability protein 1
MTTPAQLTLSLTTLGLPTPHPLFIQPIITPGPSNRLPPLQALTATAKHRLLASDLTSPNILDPSKNLCLPPNVTDAKITCRLLSGDVCVQVLEIEDVGRSKWEQIELLEMERKGETVKGREVIRTIPALPDGEAPSSASTQALGTQAAPAPKVGGPYKLLLQDLKGQKVYGFELSKVDKIGYPPMMGIGAKIMLKKGAKVARGMVLLEPRSVMVLGGRIEGLDKGWREGREKALRDAVERDRADGNGDAMEIDG